MNPRHFLHLFNRFIVTIQPLKKTFNKPIVTSLMIEVKYLSHSLYVVGWSLSEFFTRLLIFLRISGQWRMNCTWMVRIAFFIVIISAEASIHEYKNQSFTSELNGRYFQGGSECLYASNTFSCYTCLWSSKFVHLV